MLYICIQFRNTIMKKTFIIILISSLFILNKIYSQTPTYLVLCSVSDTSDNYYHAAKILSTYRNAQIVTFNPETVEYLLPTLMSIAPRYVAVVVKPSELYINFIRRFMMLSTQLDSDPFSDFSYGYITGATGLDAVNFVNKIIYADTHNIENYPLSEGGYVATSLNLVYSGTDGYMTYLNPVSSSSIWLETSNTGSGKNFFNANSFYMANKKILNIGHNGDPHMLWLFDGGNSTPTPPVWNYDSTKIENPAYARVGLTSQDIGVLNLYPAVAFNGACHSGEPKKVMVEGDIAATFGDTQGVVEFYTMSDTFSYCLNILKTGITGYFAPCGANNANDQGEDVYNAFLYHEPLGDIQKRSNDAVVMGFLGNAPNLRVYLKGTSTYSSDILASGTFDPYTYSGANSMLGGKANRIYFGDPLFNPYKYNHSDSLILTKTTLDSINTNTFNINLTFKKPDGFYPVWDKFHFGHTRIYTPVELPAYCGNISNFAVIDSSGPYNLVIHAIEHFDGKNILHIEVDIPNDMYTPINYSMKFKINYLPAGIADLQNTINKIEVYPNPSNNTTTIRFPNHENKNHTIIIYNTKGQIVSKLENNLGNEFKISIKDWQSGMYFYQINDSKSIVGQGKFIVE